MKRREHPCPACGFLTFVEPPGSYEICVVCNWENDHVQLRYPLLETGPNANSLVDTQNWVLKHFPLSMTSAGRYRRDPGWRPLSEIEIRALRKRSRPVDYFEAAAGDSPPYYWRQPE